MLYYSLIYPFLPYGIQVWSLTYPTYLPLSTMLSDVFLGTVRIFNL